MAEKKTAAAAAGMDPELVKELATILATILHDSGLTEIEVEQGGLKLRLSRAATMVQAAPTAPHPVMPNPGSVAEVHEDLRHHPGAVTSPMVGTTYLSPEPDAPAFVKEGDVVAEGQTLMVVEAMKTFNPIPAPRAGVVKRILVADRQPVEFGEALVILE